MVLVDSSVWIGFFNGVRATETDSWDALLADEPEVIGDLILTEVLQGFRTDAHYRTARVLLDGLDCRCLGGRRVAIAAPENDRLLCSRGITVCKTNDCIIATYCVLHDLELLHADRDFDAMEQHIGLRIYRPTTAL